MDHITQSPRQEPQQQAVQAEELPGAAKTVQAEQQPPALSAGSNLHSQAQQPRAGLALLLLAAPLVFFWAFLAVLSWATAAGL